METIPTSTDDHPTDVATDYRIADADLTAVLDAVGPDGWAAPSPCEGWTAADVVDHLIDAQRQFLAAHDLDAGPAPDVAADPVAAWRSHAGTVASLLDDPAVAAQPFDGHFGPTTVGETLSRFYVFDMIAHRWDVATATGQPATFTEAEMDRLETGMDGFGPALYGDGVCKGGVEAPAGADRQTAVLARLGRRAP